MGLLSFFTAAKSADDGIKVIKENGKGVIEAYKKYNDFNLKIRSVFSNSERTYFNDKSMENLLYFYLCYPIYRVIVITGAISGGKSMMINNLSHKLNKESDEEVFDYNDEHDRLILANSKSILAKMDFSDKDAPFLIVDNVQTLDQTTMDIIASYAGNLRIIIACRESTITTTNTSIVNYDFNKYKFNERKAQKGIDKAIWRKLPNFMKKPIIFDILSNSIVCKEINDNRVFAEDIEDLCRNGDKSDSLLFMYEFFDIIFTLIKDEEIDLLMLYAIVMRNGEYKDDIIKILLSLP